MSAIATPAAAPRSATSRDFPALDEHSAPEAARPALAGARRRFGHLPTPLARFALAPAMLDAAQRGLAAFQATSLTHLEQETVALTVAHRNRCEYCRRFHGRLLRAAGVDEALGEALLEGGSLADARLQAVRRFTNAVLDTAGDPDDARWAEFIAAGFTRAQALEVVLGIATYTLTTLANRLTQAPLD